MNLIEQLREYVGAEREGTGMVLRTLVKVEEEKSYAAYGHSSLYKLCIKEYGYSEPAASRRASAAHLLLRNKSWIEKLDSGELTLTNAAKLETALKVAQLKGIKVDEKALVESVFGLSAQKADRKIEEAGLKPEGKFSAEIEDKLKQLRVLLGDPRATRDELLLFALNEAIASHQPPQGDAATEVRSPDKRYVRKDLRDAISTQYMHTCSYVSEITGLKCDEQFYLEVDHTHPFALGGKTVAENLRLLCRTHNVLMAKEWGLGWPKK